MNKKENSTIFHSPNGEREIMQLYDAILEKWPVKYETKEVSTRHGNTFMIVSGENGARPLVLLHGAGTNSTMWIGDIKAYSGHYRVYAIDILGEAGKSCHNRPAWDGPVYKEWLADIWDELKIDQAAIVGISQGAWTALKFATACPEKIAGLVLISPGGIIPDNISFLLKVLPLMMLGSWGIQRIVQMLYADYPIPQGVTEVMTILMKHFKPRMGVLPIFSDEDLSRLTMPTLLIAGTKDPLRNSEKISARMGKLFQHLTVNLIPGGGHVLNNVNDIILPFLLKNKNS